MKCKDKAIIKIPWYAMGEKGNFRENIISLDKKHLVFTVIFVK